MAGWYYDPDRGIVTEAWQSWGDGPGVVRTVIAEKVAPEHGPLIVLAPRMLEIIPELIGLLDGWGIRAGAIAKARDLLGEIDAAKEAT
jgi:hypothetical protein